MVVFWEELAFICLFVWQNTVWNQTLTSENFQSEKYMWKYILSRLLPALPPPVLCDCSWRNLGKEALRLGVSSEVEEGEFRSDLRELGVLVMGAYCLESSLGN